ncbi:MAG: response regulator [Planctomycetota bacterium]
MLRFTPLNILLVDDDSVDVAALQRAFSKMKISNTITVANDGREALEILRSSAPDMERLVLLDLNLPRMSGIEFLKELRADPGLRSTIVFVLTTSKADEDKVAAYNQNVAGYIIKEQFGAEFFQVVRMLDQYWKVVEFPVRC